MNFFFVRKSTEHSSVNSSYSSELVWPVGMSLDGRGQTCARTGHPHKPPTTHNYHKQTYPSQSISSSSPSLSSCPSPSSQPLPKKETQTKKKIPTCCQQPLVCRAARGRPPLRNSECASGPWAPGGSSARQTRARPARVVHDSACSQGRQHGPHASSSTPHRGQPRAVVADAALPAG